MKIRMFGKTIEIDENNPGIKFFLEECCEFPTESWMVVENNRMTRNNLTGDSAKNELSKKSIQQLKDIIRFGIIDELKLTSDGTGINLEKEIENVQNSI